MNNFNIIIRRLKRTRFEKKLTGFISQILIKKTKIYKKISLGSDFCAGGKRQELLNGPKRLFINGPNSGALNTGGLRTGFPPT
jgi:hypothetical protein